jgi:hypothetical protein
VIDISLLTTWGIIIADTIHNIIRYPRPCKTTFTDEEKMEWITQVVPFYLLVAGVMTLAGQAISTPGFPLLLGWAVVFLVIGALVCAVMNDITRARKGGFSLIFRTPKED